MKTTLSFILGIAFFGASEMLEAQTYLPYFQYIDKVNEVQVYANGNIVQDEMGFVWIPNGNGLQRYDGYNLKTFSRTAKDSAQAITNNIRALKLGEDGLIYILSDYEGFSIFNPKTGRFKNWHPNARDTVGFFTRKVSGVEVDEDGSLWLCYRGFHHWNPSQGTIVNYYPSEMLNVPKEHAKAADGVMLVRNDPYQSKFLWLGTKLGLMRFDKEDKRIRHFPLEDPAISITTNNSRDIYFGEDDKIYLGTWYHGLHVFDKQKEEWEVHYFFGQRHTRELNNSISRIHKKEKNELWIVAPYVGVFTFNTITKTFQLISPHFKNNALPKSSPYCLNSEPLGFLKDQNEAIWIHQNHGGIEVMHPQQQQFKKVSTGTTVGQVVPDSVTGKFYLPSREGKLHRFDPVSGKLDTYPVQKKMFREALRSGLFFSDEKLRLLGLNTLYHLHPNGTVIPEKLASFDSLQALPGMYDNSHAWCFFEDSRNNLWLPLKREGILKVHLPSGKYSRQKLSHQAFGIDFNWGFPGDIIETEPYRVWISYHDGVGFSDDEGKSWTLYPFNAPCDKEMEFREITSLQTDRQGRIWMGSGRNGLFYLHYNKPHPQKLRALNVKDGLPGERVFDLELDANGNLWLITNKGLSKMDMEKLTFENFGPEYGLKGLRKLSLLPSGEIAIAASGGFYLFHPDSVQTDKSAYLPLIHGFEVLGGGFETDTAVQFLSEMELNYDQNFFTFEFSAPNFWAPQLVRYQYKLEGVDHDWVDAEDRRFANYTDISPGNYTFYVRASNVQGKWNQEDASIKMKITPPWWATWWAYVFYLLASMIVLYIIYLFKLKQKLAEAEADRLQELDEVKTRLYTNITHEFRTPLTIILGMAKQVIEDPKNHFRNGLDMIIRNGQSLLQLVNQMLDLSKLESGSMHLKLKQGEVIGFLKYLTESFYSLAESKNIELKFQTERQKLLMDFDSQKLQQIMSNLLSNAFKFTPEGGQIFVDILIKKRELSISVSDTGVGIPREKLPYVFDRFFQVENASNQHSEGSGIGLALTFELVKLMEGRIFVKSPVPGKQKGSVFVVELPIQNKAPILENEANPTGEFIPLSSVKHLSVERPPNQSTNQHTILLIEDNADVLAYLFSCLQSDYHIITAVDGAEGIDLALETTPDLIISDVMMPKKDGFEVCRTLKDDERTSHIPIILLTAKADIGSKLEGIDKGADAYIAKPFHKEELILRTRKLLELRRQLHAHYRRTAGFIDNGAGVQKQDTPSPEDIFVKRIRQAVEEHLDDYDFNVEMLCREIGMSHSQMHRKLIALTGLSTNKFIRSVRLSKAREMLSDPTLTITAVAFETGFSDPGYFSKVFKKEFGMSPAEWRE